MNILAIDWLDNVIICNEENIDSKNINFNNANNLDDINDINAILIDFEININNNMFSVTPHSNEALDWWSESIYIDLNDIQPVLFQSIEVESPYIRDIVNTMLFDNLKVFFNDKDVFSQIATVTSNPGLKARFDLHQTSGLPGTLRCSVPAS